MIKECLCSSTQQIRTQNRGTKRSRMHKIFFQTEFLHNMSTIYKNFKNLFLSFHVETYWLVPLGELIQRMLNEIFRSTLVAQSFFSQEEPSAHSLF